MSGVVFPFEKSFSRIFGTVYRPIVAVNFWSRRLKEWQEVIAIVDTGADYSLLPGFYADDFGINFRTQCLRKTTKGIGGEEPVFLFPKMKVLFLAQEFMMPVGFIQRDDIPPVIGWRGFLERFKMTLHHRKIRFEV